MFIRKAAYWSVTWSIPVLLATQLCGVLLTRQSSELHRMTVTAELMRVAVTRIAARMQDADNLDGLLFIPTQLRTYRVYVVNTSGVIVLGYGGAEIGVLGIRDAWQVCVGRTTAAVVLNAKDRLTGETYLSAACPVTLTANQYYVVIDIAKSEVMRQSAGFYVDRYITVTWLLMLSGLIMYFKPYLLLAKLPKPGESVLDAQSTMIATIRSFPSTTCGIAILDPDGIVTECSVSFAKLLDAFGTRDVIGKSFSQYTGSEELLRQLLQHPGSELTERPMMLATTVGVSRPLSVSVARQPFGHVLVLRSDETAAATTCRANSAAMTSGSDIT